MSEGYSESAIKDVQLESFCLVKQNSIEIIETSTGKNSDVIYLDLINLAFITLLQKRIMHHVSKKY